MLKGFSATTALFIFQACYGAPQIYYDYEDVELHFSVKSASTGLPLEGIKLSSSVSASGGYSRIELGTTDANGYCQAEVTYERNVVGPFIYFEDETGTYAPKDTLLADLSNRDVVISLLPKE